MPGHIVQLASEVGRTSARLAALSSDYDETKRAHAARISSLEKTFKLLQRIGVIVILWIISAAGFLESDDLTKAVSSIIIKLLTGF